jgi:long-chain acyl-CoA synthetase
VTHMGYLEPELYRPDSIGPALAQTDAIIVDTHGNTLPDGEQGELVMRGPQFMLGYWKNPAATAEALRDGWYWSGDIAVRDSEGFFRILDRRKELIKYKGFPVAPAEIEGVLLDHPAVLDCGVVGRPDDDAGEVACAFVVLKDAANKNDRFENELRAFLAEHLSAYKQPKYLRFVESIPRTASGKILRRELREMA